MANDIDGHAWVEYIDQEECWKLLAETPVGRVGVLVDSAPEIYPVNHIVDGKTIVFRTDPGTKLAGLAKSPAVCFQIDGIDPVGRRGWSVLVKGRADQVHDPDDRRRLATRGLRYWTVGLKPHWIRIRPHEVTGRRIQRAEHEPGDEAAEGPSAAGARFGVEWAPRDEE